MPRKGNRRRIRHAIRVLPFGVGLYVLAASITVALGAGQAWGASAAELWHRQVQARVAAALTRYETIAEAGGWPRVPAGETLKPGMVDTRVQALRRRLEVTGDGVPLAGDPSLYDAALEDAVRWFQMRHGLLVDGLVGPQTTAALNVSARKRVDTLRVNLARLQAFAPMGQSYVLVNVPAFEARLVNGAVSILEMRAIVGKPSWPTPSVSGKISRVVANPYWNVPHGILTKEMIPRIRREPDYLAREKIRVFENWGPEARELDPASVNWWSRAARGYRLRQEPGPDNALGQLKFLFANPYDVYLHDTPARKLFERPMRAFSHGCMRIDKPFELAVLLLQGQDGRDALAIEAAITNGRRREIKLDRPMPIHVVYWTAWVDRTNKVQFRRDLYRRDAGALQNRDDVSNADQSPDSACRPRGCC